LKDDQLRAACLTSHRGQCGHTETRAPLEEEEEQQRVQRANSKYKEQKQVDRHPLGKAGGRWLLLATAEGRWNIATCPGRPGRDRWYNGNKTQKK
jgi:hypothetical protein